VTVTLSGDAVTVDVVELPCDVTLNTGNGNDTIQVGVILPEKPENIGGVQIEEGWLTGGANGKLTIASGEGDDVVNVHNVTGELTLSGGAGDDLLYIKEYRYPDGYVKHPIGDFGAYADTETVIVNRLVDRHTVVKGDTLYDIAIRYGVTVEDLVRWNADQIDDPNLIHVGQILIVGAYSSEEQIITDRIG
jgi:LysM repeat protein